MIKSIFWITLLVTFAGILSGQVFVDQTGYSRVGEKRFWTNVSSDSFSVLEAGSQAGVFLVTGNLKAAGAPWREAGLQESVRTNPPVDGHTRHSFVGEQPHLCKARSQQTPLTDALEAHLPVRISGGVACPSKEEEKHSGRNYRSRLLN